MALGDYRFFRNVVAWHRQRCENDVFDLSGAGAPVSGTGATATGINLAGPMSTYRDITNGVYYYNVNTKANPQWITATPSTSGNGGDLFLRSRQTVAAINAGATLLPAVPGLKYRINDVTMIAIGGAVTSATLVRVMGTQAAGAVAILGVAIAALTQSAVVRAGASNATVLADGASFVANDVNTPILCDKTGSSITVATAVDFLISYSLER